MLESDSTTNHRGERFHSHEETPAQTYEQFHSEEIASLYHRLRQCDNSETLLLHTKALASLISSLADSPSDLDHNMVGSAGSLMATMLDRLQLALLREALNEQPDA